MYRVGTEKRSGKQALRKAEAVFPAKGGSVCEAGRQCHLVPVSFLFVFCFCTVISCDEICISICKEQRKPCVNEILSECVVVVLTWVVHTYRLSPLKHLLKLVIDVYMLRFT